MRAYLPEDDLFVEVVTLEPPFRYGRGAIVRHPLRGEVWIGLSRMTDERGIRLNARCAQCGTAFAAHRIGDGLKTCPGDFPVDA